ncbi:MAG: peptidylprolyl isomerase [Planctomycetota bacterium]
MSGCAAGGDPRVPVLAREADPLPTTPPEMVPPVPPRFAKGLGPEVLLPASNHEDREVARVGELVLRQSHAFTRLLSANPKLALSAVDLLVFDVLVARHAEQYAIRVAEPRVEELAAEEERKLRRQVQDELPGMEFGDYVWRLFGMREDDWRRGLRLRTAQRLYQGYVLRYLALREDRVQVRFLVHKEESVVREVVDKVRVGADFATLALRWSEDPSRRDGGLLPPFGRGFQHPAAKAAFDLETGAVSEPFLASWGGEERWFVVYCLEHQPGRDVAFDRVRAEIDADLEKAPITPLETTAYTLRWRQQVESQRSPGANPEPDPVVSGAAAK